MGTYRDDQPRGTSTAHDSTDAPPSRSSRRASRGSAGKATRASRVALELRDLILRGDLPPGSKVHLDQLRERFGVSLSPMREAVSRLVADGIVVFEDQRGYRIAPVSRDNLTEISRVRADLESLALRYAIAEADLDWESEILAALHRVDRTPRDNDDPALFEAWEQAHSDFHQALIGGCAMPTLLRFCATLHLQTDRYRRLLLPGTPLDVDVAAEHAAIADAAVARDTDRAAELLRDHIQRNGTLLAARIDPDPAD
ncbi:MAG: FCD domain-containing protein [Celeribacter sp.]|jgi:DNA-binding GntR family transcriptional regulator